MLPLSDPVRDDSVGHTLTDPELFIRGAFERSAEEGFTLLFRRYHAVLCNHAFRYVWSKDVARDLVSDVFFHFWRNQEFTTITISYRAYLFRAVRNASYNYLTRELAHHGSADALDLLNDQTPQPDQMVHFDELQHKIEATIERLPPQCKKVFLLNRFDGKKYADIAAELNISQKAVEMHISKALHTLRRVLREEWLWMAVYWILF